MSGSEAQTLLGHTPTLLRELAAVTSEDQLVLGLAKLQQWKVQISACLKKKDSFTPEEVTALQELDAFLHSHPFMTLLQNVSHEMAKLVRCARVVDKMVADKEKEEAEKAKAKAKGGGGWFSWGKSKSDKVTSDSEHSLSRSVQIESKDTSQQESSDAQSGAVDMFADLEGEQDVHGVHLSEDKWRYIGCKREVRAFYQATDSTHCFMVSGIVDSALFPLLALMLEVDLYPTWMMRVAKAQKISELASRFRQVVQTKISCIFPVSDREVLLYGYGDVIRMYPESPTVGVFFRSVEVPEEQEKDKKKAKDTRKKDCEEAKSGEKDKTRTDEEWITQGRFAPSLSEFPTSVQAFCKDSNNNKSDEKLPEIEPFTMPAVPKSCVRADMSFGGFLLTPVVGKRNRTKVTAMFHMNPKLRFVPLTLVNFFSEKFCYYLLFFMRSKAKQLRAYRIVQQYGEKDGQGGSQGGEDNQDEGKQDDKETLTEEEVKKFRKKFKKMSKKDRAEAAEYYKRIKTNRRIYGEVERRLAEEFKQ